MMDQNEMIKEVMLELHDHLVVFREKRQTLVPAPIPRDLNPSRFRRKTVARGQIGREDNFIFSNMDETKEAERPVESFAMRVIVVGLANQISR